MILSYRSNNIEGLSDLHKYTQLKKEIQTQAVCLQSHGFSLYTRINLTEVSIANGLRTDKNDSRWIQTAQKGILQRAPSFPPVPLALFISISNWILLILVKANIRIRGLSYPMYTSPWLMLSSIPDSNEKFGGETSTNTFSLHLYLIDIY